jgi:hypothetical protein
MNPAANHCPLLKSAVWRFLSLYFHRNTALPNHRTTSSNPPFPRNPHFPALRADALALSGASRRKQIPCSHADAVLPYRRDGARDMSAMGAGIGDVRRATREIVAVHIVNIAVAIIVDSVSEKTGAGTFKSITVSATQYPEIV